QSNIGGLGNLNATSYLNFKDLRERSTYFSAMAGYSFPQFVSVVTSSANACCGVVAVTTGNYFSVLGVKAAQGRVFDEQEDTRPGDAAVVVISYGFWQRRLGGDASTVGRIVRINGTAFTIVGVAPEGFRGVNSLISPDMWLPS